MKLRVVVLYNSSWYIYLLRRNLIQALQGSGCDVTVVAPEDSYSSRVRALGVNFEPIEMTGRGTNPFSELRSMLHIRAALSRVRPHVVLSYTVKCNLYAGLVRRLVPFKQIANISGLGEGFDGGVMHRLLSMLYRVALGGGDKIFFQNPDDLQRCVEGGLVRRDASELIPGSGVDLQAFHPAKETQLGRAPRVFLIFGRLLPKKGFYAFIEAARTLRAQWGDEVAFWVMGSPDHERAESEELYQAVLAAHAEGAIRYLQSTDDVRPILHEASVVVLPSTYNEGVPRSLLEALAAGKPIITTDWKGCRETVKHGKNGFLVRPDDALSLRSALESMITCTPERLGAMGQASRRLAETHFDEQIVLRAYLRAVGIESRLQEEPPRAQAA